MTDPVAIRYKNPGAMWPCAIATRFGSTSTEHLTDAQKNQAAIFPTCVQGAAAQFALWDHGYSGMTLDAAIYKWSGHNSSKTYEGFLESHVPDLHPTTIISHEFLAGPNGLALMKAQAQWEAGRPYPMTDDEWHAAQRMAFGGAAPSAPQQTNWLSAIISAVIGAFRGSQR